MLSPDGAWLITASAPGDSSKFTWLVSGSNLIFFERWLARGFLDFEMVSRGRLSFRQCNHLARCLL